LAGSPPKNAPARDQIEVSLFGPGFGECVVIHVGFGEWIIVDSCTGPASRAPVALDYLRTLGVDPAVAVRLVVATHWHDDHVKGLSGLVRACASARFACSDALRSDEFQTLVEVFGTGTMLSSSGVDEMKTVFEILRERRKTDPAASVPVCAVADRCLWQRQRDPGGISCEIHSLSPSDAELMAAKLGLTRLMPGPKGPKRRIGNLLPDETAVALLVTVGGVSVLSGSDLEEHGTAGSGWSAVVASPCKPRSTSAVFKVPHHGSETADHPPVWTSMLSENPVAVLTPFILGRHALPTAEMAGRILKRTDRAFITRSPKRDKPVKRAAVVERTLRETVRRITPIEVEPGHIRLRYSLSEGAPAEWTTDLFDGACTLADHAVAG
jgi:hypothetical protein